MIMAWHFLRGCSSDEVACWCRVLRRSVHPLLRRLPGSAGAARAAWASSKQPRDVSRSMSDILERGSVSALAQALNLAGVSTPPGTVRCFGSCWCRSLAVSWACSIGPLLALLALVVPAIVARSWVNSKVTKRRNKFAEQLPDMLQLLIASMRSGFGLSQALTMIADEVEEPATSEIEQVLADDSGGFRPVRCAAHDGATDGQRRTWSGSSRPSTSTGRQAATWPRCSGERQRHHSGASAHPAQDPHLHRRGSFVGSDPPRAASRVLPPGMGGQPRRDLQPLFGRGPAPRSSWRWRSWVWAGSGFARSSRSSSKEPTCSYCSPS